MTPAKPRAHSRAQWVRGRRCARWTCTAQDKQPGRPRSTLAATLACKALAPSHQCSLSCAGRGKSFGKGIGNSFTAVGPDWTQRAQRRCIDGPGWHLRHRFAELATRSCRDHSNALTAFNGRARGGAPAKVRGRRKFTPPGANTDVECGNARVGWLPGHSFDHSPENPLGQPPQQHLSSCSRSRLDG